MGYLNGEGAHGTGKTIAGFAARAHAAWRPTIKKKTASSRATLSLGTPLR